MAGLVLEQDAFLSDVCRLHLYVKTTCHFLVTGGELYRSIEQEERYIQEGKSKLVDPSHNYHTKRLAIDFNFFTLEGAPIADYEMLKPVGSYWKFLYPKNVWGGDWTFKDLGHFERHI